MAKYIDADKLKAEIERLKEGASIGLSEYDAGHENGVCETCNDLLSFISTLESEKPMNPDDAMKELDEKIALVKQRGTWDGVDVDKYMDEVRGREPEKPMEGLEVASVELADMLLAKQKDYAISAKADYWNGAHDGVIAGAFWRVLNGPIPLSPEHLYGSFTLEIEEPCEELEEELDQWRHSHFNGKRDGHFSGEYLERTSQLDLARHFAQWGAEHAEKGETPVPKDLEEAAEEYRKGVCEHPMYYTYTKQCFIAGAKWQKEQMLKETVDAEVIVPIYEGKYEGNDVWSAEIKIPGRYEVGDKVRVIVIPNTDKK